MLTQLYQTGPSDDDQKWDIRYPEYLLQWLHHQMELYQMNPAEVLAFEDRRPGLLGQLELFIWQKQLLKKGLEEAAKD